MSDVLAKDHTAYYLKTPTNPVIAKYSLYCRLKSNKTRIFAFDAKLNMSYCNIFNNSAGDCSDGIITFYGQATEVYIDNCAIYYNGCGDNTIGKNPDKTMQLHINNCYIDHYKAGARVTLHTSNVTNSYYTYDLPLFETDIYKNTQIAHISLLNRLYKRR